MSQGKEKQLEKTFKIPKRKADEMCSYNSNGSELYNAGHSLATNSYYEYYNQYTQAQWQQSTAYPQQYYTQQGTSTITNAVNPITQNIFNTLSSIKEKPKNYHKNIFKDTVPDISDASLPKELTSLFQPLFCKLCTAQLSSNVMAKLHYRSKNHDKKVRNFLIKHAQETGTPLHKRAKVVGNSNTEEEFNPKWFHCDVCDLPLTGKMHAESHYMGKNHQRVIMGYRMPAGDGSYSVDGKWIRSTPTKKMVLKDNEDTFGQDFKKQNEIGVALMPPTPLAVVSQATASNNPLKFHCILCNVKTNCQEQLDIHFQGQRHNKKIAQIGICSDGQFTGNDNSLNSAKDVDLFVYRTPSGSYYCPTCNITLSSDVQFKLHLKGKQHVKKSNNKQS